LQNKGFTFGFYFSIINQNLVPLKNMKNIVARSRRAKFDYHIEEVIEAGIVLSGSEVKSLRAGKASLLDAFAEIDDNQLYLNNCHIPEYLQANRFNHQPKRTRKLLLHKREIKKLIGKVKIKGYTIIPTCIYFNEKNIAKVEIGIAKGKSAIDKRVTIKEREWERSKNRILKGQ
jgi:SsrA-binding protein